MSTSQQVPVGTSALDTRSLANVYKWLYRCFKDWLKRQEKMRGKIDVELLKKMC